MEDMVDIKRLFFSSLIVPIIWLEKNLRSILDVIYYFYPLNTSLSRLMELQYICIYSKCSMTQMSVYGLV